MRKMKHPRCSRGLHDYQKINQYMKECKNCEKRVRIGFDIRKNKISNIGRKRR